MRDGSFEMTEGSRVRKVESSHDQGWNAAEGRPNASNIGRVRHLSVSKPFSRI